MKKNTKGTILNESTIRRFMKLANIEPLAESYLGQFTEEEDEMDAEAPAPEMDADMGAEEPAMGDEAEVAVGGAAEAVPQEAVEEIVAAIASAVEEVTGTPVSSEPADAAGEEAPAMDEPEALEEPAAAGEDEEAPATRYEQKDDKGEEEEELAEKAHEEDEKDEEKAEEALIRRVAERVAERLRRRR